MNKFIPIYLKFYTGKVLEKYVLPVMTQEDVENMNSPIITEDIERIVCKSGLLKE